MRVLTDRKDGLKGLARATAAGIPTAELRSYPYRQNTVPGRTFEEPTEEERKSFREPWRRAFDADLAGLVGRDAPEVVVCAGESMGHVLSEVGVAGEANRCQVVLG